MLSSNQPKHDPAELFPILPRNEYFILELLIQSTRELYGLEMVKASNGLLKRGTIYVTLQRMQAKGVLDSRSEVRIAPEVGIPRRLYRVTGYGELVYNAHRAASAIMRSELVPVSN